jgi:tryptophanyl-tRNA synthetase
MKRIFSGAQPTGDIHLGNYLGALLNWTKLQHEYDSFYCIVDLHAITQPQNPRLLQDKVRELTRLYIASGVDPERATIFVQSDVPEHAELTWILNCSTRIGELERMTQFKEKGRSKERSDTGVGLLDYPVLMAADILLYQTDLVPVGGDQRQHLELTRDLAARFNRDFGEVFRIPEPFIPKAGARIMSLADPTRKMSKSDENLAGTIFLSDDAATVERKFKRAVTDSGSEIKFDDSRPGVTNLLTIYSILTGKSQADTEADFEGKGYGQLKAGVADATNEFLRPLQERIGSISDAELQRILREGAERARTVAGETLDKVKNLTGLTGWRGITT